jgi:hypothetical protein
MDPIFTRVGLIIDGDNRFFGRSSFDEWPQDITCASDTVLTALRARITPAAREAMRLAAITLMSPDARVWPLKLTRLLSSYGDPVAGYFGAQLVSAGRIMGPGAGTAAARALCFVANETGAEGSDEEVARAAHAWRERCNNRVGGFGVPFRDADERRVALLRLAAGGPVVEGRYWRLHERVVRAMEPARPNIAFSIAAMLLDAGIDAEHVGIAMSMLMTHVFLAHAIEGVDDGARANTLPVESVHYVGVGARRTSQPQP